MPPVQTVTGPIALSNLGRTLVHEHVFVLSPEFNDNYQQEWDEEVRVADAVDKLRELKALGIDSIMDPTVLGLGRYIPRVQQIAAQIDLNIVVATGVYTWDEIPHQFESRGPGLLIDVPEPLVEIFVEDITKGIGGTGVRAGILKCAIDQKGLTPGVERVMRAVGQAHVQTGAPITVHTHPHSRSGLVAQAVLKEEGVPLSKVIVGHSGDSNDIDYLCELAEAGSLLGMDRFGINIENSTERRIATIVELVRRGYLERIVISHDANCFIDYLTIEQKETFLPQWNYRHISEDVLPALLKAGLTESDIDTILVDNPRRHFE